MLGTTEKNTYFTKLKAGGRFAIYAFGIYLATTFTIGYLGLIIGFPLLTLPLAMLISRPVVWVVMGIVLTAAYKMAVEPLFHLVKDYINGKRTSQGRQKTPDGDSGIFECKEDKNSFVYKTENGDYKCYLSTTDIGDSGIFECKEDKNSFVYKTENGDYKCYLSTTDIIDIAKSKYKWIAYIDRKGSKDTSQGVYFTCPDNLESSLQAQLEKYKSQVELRDKNLIFTSILNLNGNHWVTLVVAYNPNSVSRAYYCDSFGKDLPDKISDALQKTLKIDSNNIGISKKKQQEDGYNCGIFALENAHTITQMLKGDKSFDDIDKKLSKYKPDSKKLEEKRKEFAEALKDDISRRSSVASGDNGLGVGPKVVTHNTAGDGNCFFHAAFGDDSSGQYKAEKAQEMRLEWHKFLSQFTSLNDASMPAPLKAQLGKVFNMFLNKPEDLTGKSNEIKKLAEYTNKKIKKIKKKVEKLIRRLLRVGLPENEVSSNLKEFAVSNFFSTRRYDKNYSSESVANSFLNSKSIYKSYLEAISSQSYYVFIEEIPILASLAKIEIDVHYKNNGKDVHTVFKPNSEMINESYQQNNELWGEKEKEIIYLAANHYSRAEIVEIEKTQSVLEKIGSVVQGAVASVRNALG